MIKQFSNIIFSTILLLFDFISLINVLCCYERCRHGTEPRKAVQTAQVRITMQEINSQLFHKHVIEQLAGKELSHPNRRNANCSHRYFDIYRMHSKQFKLALPDKLRSVTSRSMSKFNACRLMQTSNRSHDAKLTPYFSYLFANYQRIMITLHV